MAEIRIGARGAPWHLWAVGVVAVIWSGIGAFDYLMTQTENAAYMAAFSDEQRAYFYGFPAWVNAAWAVAVWGGVLGGLLLLIRNKYAALIFLASIAGLVISTIYNFALSDGLEMMGAGGAGFTVVIFALDFAFWFYARAMAARGVLK